LVGGNNVAAAGHGGVPVPKISLPFLRNGDDQANHQFQARICTIFHSFFGDKYDIAMQVISWTTHLRANPITLLIATPVLQHIQNANFT
jgi:hypothetical protein